MNTDLFLYLLLPVGLSAITVVVLRSRSEFLDIIKFVCGGLAISSILLVAAFYIGKNSKTSDTQVINGEVLSKNREHGFYIRTYSCNCYESCSGSGSSRSCTEVCQTCYEDHYTVNWACQSNIGEFGIDHLDRTSRSVYDAPNPNRWVQILKGDPVSKVIPYTNYMKAVPESLFRPASASLREKYHKFIPAYPIDIYDIYKINRVVPVGVSIPKLQEWNDKLSETLKTLGPQKQANAVIVITKYGDDFFYALQDAWLNGKKNDIGVVIGIEDLEHPPKWVRIMALTQGDIFQVRLRDRLLSLPKLGADQVIDAIKSETLSTFKRRHMHDFAYLNAEIDPPAWVMITTCILIVGAYVGFFIVILRGNL